MTSSDQVEERHQYFSIIFFVTGRCVSQTTSGKSALFPSDLSCLDYLLRGAFKCGIYKLYDSKSGNSFPAYCDLKCEPGTAWTLVMSWSVDYRWLPPFTKFPFKYNSPLNENAQNWNLYRLSLVRMRSLQLPDLRHRFQRLAPRKLQGFQHRWFPWRPPVQESGIHQHPGTRGYAFDGAFLAEAKFIHSAYWQYIHSLSV